MKRAPKRRVFVEPCDDCIRVVGDELGWSAEDRAEQRARRDALAGLAPKPPTPLGGPPRA